MRMATGLIRSAVYALGRATRRIVVFIALCVISAGVYAASCNPTTPRLDSGAGFTPFGENEQALARAGHSGPAWEWALGTNTDSVQKVQGSLDWVSGKVYKWRLVNDGAGKEVLTIRNGGKVVLKLAYRSRMDAGNALELRISTSPSVGPGTNIAATLTRLNGHGVSGTLSQSGTREQVAQALYYYFPEMANGFTATGTISLTYRRKPPSGSRVHFAVRAGTIPCNAPGNPPTVSITAPAANSTFNAPATISVSADADGIDSLITQVAFYANGKLIGTVSSSPFAIQWLNVRAGAYSLTAVAIDKNGLLTTTAAVPIVVNATLSLYFIHVDYLNTPRLIANATGTPRWRWNQGEPFGESMANEDPDGTSVAFTFPQRLPGQYYDAQTGHHYNYFRDYNPSLGRYAESDPIGLGGGSNRYVYVTGSPLLYYDPHGLLATFIHSEITYHAILRDGMRISEAYELAGLVANADFYPTFRESQAIESAHRHCMAKPGQSRAQAQHDYERYITDELQKCTKRGLANALHAAQDCTAGGHHDFQTYGGVITLEHLKMDVKPTPAERELAFQRTRDLVAKWRSICQCQVP